MNALQFTFYHLPETPAQELNFKAKTPKQITVTPGHSDMSCTEGFTEMQSTFCRGMERGCVDTGPW